MYICAHTYIKLVLIFNSYYAHTLHSLLSQRIPLVKPAAGNSNQDDTNRPESPLKKKPSTDQFKSISTPSFANYTNKKQESFDVRSYVNTIYCTSGNIYHVSIWLHAHTSIHIPHYAQTDRQTHVRMCTHVHTHMHTRIHLVHTYMYYCILC